MSDEIQPDKWLAELRGKVVMSTDTIARLVRRRDKLRERLSDVIAEIRRESSERDNHIRAARRAGVAAEDLAADSGLTQGRIRQIAPHPGGRPGRPRKAPGVRRAGGSSTAAARPRRTEVTAPVDELLVDEQLVDDGREAEACEVVQTPAGAALVRGGGPPAPRAPRPRGKKLPALQGPYSIVARVEQALTVHGGDVEAATAALVASAIPDAMTLLDLCRAGARYDYTAHPSLPEPLQPRGRKKADLIWEGRPRWRHPSTPAGSYIEVLDTNAAYLAALRRVHLPIGKLVQDPDGTPFDPRRSGIYLCDVPAWSVPDVPDPLGNGREETGPVWITRPTLQLLHRAYGPDMPIPVLQSYTSGSSENLLTRFGDELARARAAAIESGHTVALEYVKAMYSKFVSTAGSSGANHELFRPEWVHAIRSQAFMNLWLKGAKAASAGLYVHAMVGTDELHVSGDWRHAVYNGRPAFPEGRGLAEVKCKRTYTIGGDQDQEVSGGA